MTTHTDQGGLVRVDYSKHLLLLLLSHFSRVRLCATPQTAAHQAPPSWDSPGKNTGVGCHFLLQCMKVKIESEIAQLCLTQNTQKSFITFQIGNLRKIKSSQCLCLVFSSVKCSYLITDHFCSSLLRYNFAGVKSMHIINLPAPRFYISKITVCTHLYLVSFVQCCRHSILKQQNFYHTLKQSAQNLLICGKWNLKRFQTKSFLKIYLFSCIGSQLPLSLNPLCMSL